MHTRSLPALLTLGLLTGCGLEGAVPDGAHLLVPEDVEFHWDSSFNGVDDGVGVLVPFDVMVYDGVTGEPVGFVAVELHSAYAAFTTPDAVVPVRPDDCGDCAYVWDAWRDQYVELSDAEEAPLPRAMSLLTDESGLARAYVFVDALPADGDHFGSIHVGVGLGALEASFRLLPQ